MSLEVAVRQPFDPYAELRRNLLTPARVRELSRLRPQRAVFDALRCWLVIVAAWVVVALWPTWWTVLLAIPLIGTRYYALFIIGHDGLHRRLFTRAEHNDLFGDLFVFAPIGAITRINNRNHISHHRHLCTPLDPDRHLHASYNKTDHVELITFLAGAASLVRSIRNVFGGGAAPAAATTKAPAAGYRVRDLALLLGWQISLIAGLSIGVGFWAYPALWLLPFFSFTYLSNNARAFLEHAQPEPDALADAHRLTTFQSNPLELLVFAPMHMNFHAAHHLWPSIPYYNLPTANREMHAISAAAAIELRGSYLTYLWRYFRALPLGAAASAQHEQGRA